MSHFVIATSISAVAADNTNFLDPATAAGETAGLCTKYSQEMALASTINAASGQQQQLYHEVIHSPITPQNIQQIAQQYQQANMPPPQYYTSSLNNAAWQACCAPSVLTQMLGIDAQAQAEKQFCANAATMIAAGQLPQDTPRTFTVFDLKYKFNANDVFTTANKLLQQCKTYTLPVQDVTNSFSGQKKEISYMWACEGDAMGIEIGNTPINVGVGTSHAIHKKNPNGSGKKWGLPKQGFNDDNKYCDRQRHADRFCAQHCSMAGLALSTITGNSNDSLDQCSPEFDFGVIIPKAGLLGASEDETCNKDSCCTFACSLPINVNFNTLAGPTTGWNPMSNTPFGIFGRELDDEHKEAAEKPIVV